MIKGLANETGTVVVLSNAQKVYHIVCEAEGNYTKIWSGHCEPYRTLHLQSQKDLS